MGSTRAHGQEERGRTVAGYEVVGPSARGHLVRAPDGDVLEARRCSAEQSASVLRSGLAALPPHGHRESLVDLAEDDGVVVLLTRPAVVETLARILERGHRLPPGAAVTVLAPIAGALRDARDHGVLLPVDAAAIGLTADGRPVLLLEEERPAPTPESDFRAVLLAAAPGSAPPYDADLAALEAHLYRSAAPAPLGALLTAPALAPADPVPQQTGRPGARAPAAAIAERWRRRLRRRPTTAGAEATARHRRVHPLDGWRSRAVARASARRGPLLAAAAVVAGALVAALVSGSGEEVRPAPGPSVRATADIAPSAGPIEPPSAELPAAEAAIALLGSFASCSAEEEPTCAAAVTAEDSPLRSPGAPEFVAGLGTVDRAVVTDEQGASSLLAIDVRSEAGETTAASVLIIRTEAGWLIREVFAEEAG